MYTNASEGQNKNQMYTNASEGPQWSQDTWDHLNQLVCDEIQTALAVKILPHYEVSAPTTTMAVSADIILIDGHRGSVVEGKTTSLADLSSNMALTEQQAYGEDNATTIESLTVDRARRVKQIIDGVTFQGDDIFTNPLFKGVVYRNANKVIGLLDAAHEHVDVPPINSNGVPESHTGASQSHTHNAKRYGEHTFEAVKKAVSILAGNGYEGSTVLVLHTDEYADADTLPPETLVTPLERLEKLVTDGVYQSAMVPPSTGFLLAKGRSTVDLAWVKPRIESAEKRPGEYTLRVVSRFTPRVKDGGLSIVRLNFL